MRCKRLLKTNTAQGNNRGYPRYGAANSDSVERCVRDAGHVIVVRVHVQAIKPEVPARWQPCRDSREHQLEKNLQADCDLPDKTELVV